ncbi:LCP family protein [Erysipelotrichaceae bacterium HCN-30851]
MSKKKSKAKKKKPIYKTGSFYFVLIYALLTIGMIIQLFTVNIIPMKYVIIATIVLVLLLLAMYYLQMGKHINKVNKILGKILIIILSILLGIGNFMLFKAGSVFSRITGDNMETTVISVVVMKENEAEKIQDLKNSEFGKTKTGDQEILEKCIKDIEADVDQAISTVDYSSYKEIGNDLYSGTIDAIILDESTRGLFEDNHPNFDSETKVIKSYKYKTESKDISKSVNVTEDAFNVYITGIDTYGSITTASRSDVNMIATINPKTHQILLTSIPRDYYVPQPCQDNQKDKLTHTGIYGVDCTIETVENYFDIDLNYYVRVNFSSLVDIVNALDGITVDNPVAFTSIDGTYFPEGSIEMDGNMALSYSRERKNLSGGDRDRGKNQMRVITGIINKAISPKIITNYTSIMDAVSDSFQTNMSNKEMTSLIKMQLDEMSGWDIEQISVNGTGNASAWSPANGFNSWVMEPNVETVQKAVDLIQRVQNGEDVKDLAQQVMEENTANE